MEDGSPAAAPESTQIESDPSQVTGSVPATDESVPSSPEPSTEAPAAPPKPSKQEIIAQLAEFGDDLTHDDLKVVPAYNKRQMQWIQQQQARKAQDDELAGADGFFNTLTPEQLVALQNNDEFARVTTHGKYDAAGVRKLYDNVQGWKREGALTNSGIYERVAGSMLDNLKEYFHENSDYPEIGKVWDKIAAEGDGTREGFAKFFAAAVKAEAAGAIRLAKVQIEAEKEAAINEIKSQYLGGQDQPDHLPAGAPTGNGSDRWSRWMNDPAYRKSLTPQQEADLLSSVGARVG